MTFLTLLRAVAVALSTFAAASAAALAAFSGRFHETAGATEDAALWAVGCVDTKNARAAQGASPSAARAAAVVTMAFLAAGTAVAQQEPGDIFGDWRMQCEAQQGGGSKCFISHNKVTPDTGNRVVNVNLGYIGPRDAPMLVAFLPLGIDLQAGAVVHIEPGQQVRLSIHMCTSAGCRASVTLDAKTFEALRGATRVVFWVIPYGTDKWVDIPVSVNGLAAGLASLSK